MSEYPKNKAVGELKKLMVKHDIKPLALSIATGLVPSRVSEVLNEGRKISATADLILCKFFKLKDGHFLKLQLDYELELAHQKLGDRLKKINTVDLRTPRI